MNLALTPDLEKLIDEELATGVYESPGEVVREALLFLKERSLLRRQRLEALRREAHLGLEQLDRGEYSELDADQMRELADEIKSRGRARLTAGDHPAR